jgi:diguanylate cyclase (GGDEF)-like protein
MKNIETLHSNINLAPTSQTYSRKNSIRWTDQDGLKESTILIVEEGASHTRLTELILDNIGFTNLLTAQTDLAAWEIINNSIHADYKDIDLIIIDMMTHGVDAMSLCKSLKKDVNFSEIPILLVSPNVKWCDEAISTGLDAGALDIIFKPLQQHNMLPRVLTLLRLKKERDARYIKQRQLESELAERKIMEARLKFMLNHDELTGLCNRKRLEQSLDVAGFQADLNGRQSALIYIDLNHFKTINDLEGHDAGDRLLTTIANVLRKYSSTNATISRINSDEYAILFEDCNEKTAFVHANSLRKEIDALQFRVDNRKYHVAASFGIVAIKPGIKHSSGEILGCADKACYEAKRKGRNSIHIYNKNDNKFDLLREDAYWVPRIRDALSSSKFKLLFQPVMDMANNKIDRFEALIRMIDINNDLITPDNFIPVAERNGLIQKIDLWVINRAFDMLASSIKVNNNVTFNINLSSHAFNEPNFLPLVKNKLEQTRIEAKRITFEITETAAVTNYKQGRDMLHKLRSLGFKIALDDFGSGFNSFSHLKQLPIDYIKIDGSFITNLLNDVTDQTLVKSITDIAKKLGKKTVAEFVVNLETLDILRSYGVDYAQGYYIGKPQDINMYNSMRINSIL